ncbi:MAG: hypothetical protein INH41_00495 [Myxococcaceae bacterium]|nr:hypothetical protein [Myxococcaceae bacterium]MCA3010855.1 hypothetical protein [Myxococcaceae bacterium]
MRPFTAALAGVLLGSAAAGGLTVQSVTRRVANARAGCNLVPIVVVAVDVKAGETLSMEHLSQRAIPEQFLGPSMVRPDEAADVVGQRVTMALPAGAPVPWAAVESPSWAEAFSSCVAAVRPPVDARASAVGQRGLARVQAGARTASAPPPPLDVPGDGPGLRVTRALAVGEVLRPDDVAAVQVPPMLRTVSLVRAADRELVVGARALVELEPGDVLRWQLLDDADAPSTAAGCEVALASEVAAARGEAAREAAKAWAARQPTGSATP